MAKTIKAFRAVLTFIICFLTALNVVSICAQVAIRFFFDTSMAWVSELAGVSLVWITFLGATLATLDESNIYFDGFLNKLQGGKKLALKTIINVLILVMVYILIRYGYSAMKFGFNTMMVAMPTNMGVCSSVIPVSGVMMCAAIIINQVKAIKEYRGENIDIGDIASTYDDVPEEVLQKANESIESFDQKASGEEVAK